MPLVTHTYPTHTPHDAKYVADSILEHMNAYHEGTLVVRIPVEWGWKSQEELDVIIKVLAKRPNANYTKRVGKIFIRLEFTF